MNPLTKFTPQVKERFLEVLEDTCTVKTACEAVGISRNLAYNHKKADLEFSHAWNAAIERALDALLGTAYTRATEEKSDQVLITLLRFRYGDQMRERLSVQVEQTTGLDPDALLQMSAPDRLALQQLLGKYTQAEQIAHGDHQAALVHNDGQT
ncbi:MAG: hypothetical protein M3Q42_08295 [Pseudomonadota bacterium]|nr:hypothetical protein [Pseudomonadota bacterium]